MRKEILLDTIKELGFVIGCYDNEIEELNDKEFNKVLNQIDNEYTDVPVKLNRKKYIVEISTVDNEKDISIISFKEYLNKYGEEYKDKFTWK